MEDESHEDLSLGMVAEVMVQEREKWLVLHETDRNWMVRAKETVVVMKM